MKIETKEISLPLLDEKEVRLFIKRIDKIHPFVSGNKWFKLKYNLLEAKKQGLNTLLTFGGAYSNHISAAITYDQYKQLYKEVGLDYKGQKEINKKIKEDEFFNALQIKFAYAITCHKSQGGQWENVFIDLGYFTEDMLDKSYLRWLYTALTRASKKLYLINFKNEFFHVSFPSYSFKNMLLSLNSCMI